MSALRDCTEMSGLTNEQAATKAIRHVLTQIRTRPEVGWYLNIGTQSFALLTEAFARLCGADVAAVRDQFVCPNAKNPEKQPNAEEIEAAAKKSTEDKGMLLEMMMDSDVIEFIDELSIPSRMDLLQALRDRYCADCGAVHVIRFGPCDCIARRQNMALRLEVVR